MRTDNAMLKKAALKKKSFKFKITLNLIERP